MVLQPSTGDNGDGVRRRRFLRVAATVGGVSLAPLPVAGRAQSGNGGEELWRFRTGDWVTASPTVVGGTVYVGSFDASVYALDAATGRQQWRYGTNSPITSAPAVVAAADGDSKRVFVGTQARLYSLDGDTGEHRWETASTSVASPSARAHRIVFTDDNINGLRRGDGTREWRTITTGTVDSGWIRVHNTSPTVVADTEQAGDGSGSGSADDYTVFVGTDEGRLYVLDLATGETQWRFNLSEPIRSSPTVADGTVFVGGWDGAVYALDAGVDGSSAGTRVRQGTLGHHHAFAGDPPQTLSMAAAGAVHTPEPAGNSAENSGEDTADDGGAGFGVVAALGGLGGAGYLLRRTLCTDRPRE